jgi:ADP-heptose:LPS heptosyltransferase
LSETLQTYETIGVIVGRDLVGDALIKLPFLRALRNAFPPARISWITSQGPTAFASVLREPTRSLIDQIYEKPDWLGVWDRRSQIRDMMAKLFFYSPAPAAHARAPFFDLVIDTRNRWREAIYARRVPHKVFIAPAMHFLFSERKPPFLGSRPLHLCGRLLELVALAAGHVPPSTGALPAPAEAVKKARRILPEGNIYVGLAPGAGDLTKAWPRYKFEKVALAQAAKGRVPVFILGPQELGWYDELQATVPQAKFPLQEYDLWGEHAITLDHTLAIGALLNAAVANDSGAGHMLAAIDCPLISLFGPTSPDKLAPQVTHGIVLRAQDFGSSQTRAISEQAVNDAIDKLLSIKGSK